MKSTKEPNPYEDIIHLSRPVSEKYPPMPLSKRAAQFSPFAALSGFSAAIRDAGHITEQKREISEEMKTDIGQKLYLLNKNLKEQHEITITYFVPDNKKEGGKYINISGYAKKIDVYSGFLIMNTGDIIYFDDITDISGDLFDAFF